MDWNIYEQVLLTVFGNIIDRMPKFTTIYIELMYEDMNTTASNINNSGLYMLPLNLSVN